MAGKEGVEPPHAVVAAWPLIRNQAPCHSVTSPLALTPKRVHPVWRSLENPIHVSIQRPSENIRADFLPALSEFLSEIGGSYRAFFRDENFVNEVRNASWFETSAATATSYSFVVRLAFEIAKRRFEFLNFPALRFDSSLDYIRYDAHAGIRAKIQPRVKFITLTLQADGAYRFRLPKYRNLRSLGGFLGKLLKRERRSGNHVAQRIREKVRIFAPIEAKLHLLQVSGEMLRTQSVPRSHQAALQETESRFDAVRVNVSLHIDSRPVPNRLMLSLPAKMTGSATIQPEIISHQAIHIFPNVFTDILLESPRSHVLSMEKSEFALPLPKSYYYFLVRRSSSALTMSATAQVEFIHFNRSSQALTICFFHRGADSVTQEPRSAVTSNTESALNLASGYSLFGFAQQERSREPSEQRQVRILKHATNSHAELIIALPAPKQACAQPCQLFTLAAWTLRAIGPAQPFQELAAPVIAWEFFREFEKVHRRVSRE